MTLSHILTTLANVEAAWDMTNLSEGFKRGQIGRAYQTIVGYHPFEDDPDVPTLVILNTLRENVACRLMAAVEATSGEQPQ